MQLCLVHGTYYYDKQLCSVAYNDIVVLFTLSEGTRSTYRTKENFTTKHMACYASSIIRLMLTMSRWHSEAMSSDLYHLSTL